MIYFLLAFELIAIIFLSFGMEKLWARYINNKVLRLALHPGKIAHELSHAFLCLITGTTIKELNIFKLENNNIQYEKPKISVIGNFFIAAAPIFGCGVILLFLADLLGGTAISNPSMPDTMDWHKHTRNLIEAIKITITAFSKHISLENIRQLIFIPLGIIFTVSMAPSRGDIKFLVIGFIVLAAILFFIEFLGISLKDYRWWTTLLNAIWHLITLSMSILLTLLCITVVLIGVFKGFKLTFSRKSNGKDGAGARIKPAISNE